MTKCVGPRNREMLYVIFFIVVCSIGVVLGLNEAETLSAAKRTYQRSLSNLRHDPNNPELRYRTLTRGREYAHLCRNKQGVGIFDEVALLNDINAACAGAVTMNEAPSRTLLDRLSQLEELRNAGLISVSEFETQRASILASV